MNSMLSESIDIEKTIHVKRIDMIAVMGEDVIQILLLNYIKREKSYLTAVVIIFEIIFIFVQTVIINKFDAK